MQTSVFLSVKYCFLHMGQMVFRKLSLFTQVVWLIIALVLGKLIALLWQSGAHAEQLGMPQSFPQFAGLATTALPF